MTKEKVLEAISIYRERFGQMGITKKDFNHVLLMPGAMHALQHCYGMLDEMEIFVAEGRIDKVFRWLGFVQGVLWAYGYYSLENLKNHNRPDQADA